MQRPISFTFIIIVTICSLMNIIALMPATEANCCVWEENYQRNFITYIPPNNQGSYYCFSCATFNGMEQHGADVRNGILTQQTLDCKRCKSRSDYKGGYNKNTCFRVYGDRNYATLAESPYEECEKIRDSK
ncbi:14143_t:CDS:2 [Funneliformis geosporum]|uniref:14143_t:CDS:1 n=1 Tax=Funneliformis geosporum TaxID=1117311 RepID=A0A9W4SX08_9GLOM|nr:14143_t:CDS:2 [Funneliformis geosporum]